MFNSYGASLDWMRATARCCATTAAMIEANRTPYRDKAKVIPIIAKRPEKRPNVSDYAIDVLTKNCMWSVNGRLSTRQRTQWTIDNSVERRCAQEQEGRRRAGCAILRLPRRRSTPPADPRRSDECKL
jgi:hypothetical protein